MQTKILIAAYNEQEDIKDVINLSKQFGDVFVIDDFSTDKTVKLSKDAFAKVIENPVNMGKGCSLRNAILYLHWFEHMKKNDIIVFLDGDGQHRPNDIPKLVKKLKTENLDVVFGQRDFSKYPPIRRHTNRLLSSLFSLLLGKNVGDIECGFRCMRWDAILGIYKHLSAKHFEIDSEMAILFFLFKYKVGFVKISSPYFGRSRPTIIPGVKIILLLLKTILKIKVLKRT